MAANPHPTVETPILTLEFLTPSELEECQKDPTWEARHGIVAHAVCRMCGAKVRRALSSGRSKRGHLWVQHQMTSSTYRELYPGARLISFQESAALNARGRGTTVDINKLMAHAVASYVTPEELEECRRDPAWEARQGILDWIVCRECGVKRTRLCWGPTNANSNWHLREDHKMTREEYQAKYPGARLFAFKGYLKNLEKAAIEFAAQWITPEQLMECRNDPEWEIHREIEGIICRECARRVLSPSLRRHCSSNHGGMTKGDYLAKYPGAPWRNRASKILFEELKKAAAAAVGERQKLSVIESAKRPSGARGLKKGTLLRDTPARITVAAAMGEIKPAAMAPRLYPNTSKDLARHNAVVFLTRHGAKIAAERNRLQGLPEGERQAAVDKAKRALASTSVTT